MFGHRVTLFSMFGLPLRMDLSWLLVFFLVAWSLAEGVFPHYADGLTPGAYWLMGFIGALALFTCIVLHELGHALVARRVGIKMKGITLFIFGGVAEMSEDPRSARAEFLMAVAGPVVSVALALLLWGLAHAGWPEPVTAVVAYLAAVNVILVAFNLLPAFPLDGGRILRAALWGWTSNVRWATNVASRIGSGFGIAFMVMAVFHLVAGSLIGAIWWFVLGLFLRGSARMSYKQVVWHQLLANTSVRRLMTAEPTTVPPDATVAQFVDNYLYHYHYKLFPVVQDGKLLGCITTRDVKHVPRSEWPQRHVGEVMRPVPSDAAINADADAGSALSIMNDAGKSRLMVVDHDHLVGVVTLKDLSTYIARKMDLEGDDGRDN
jgi:Zn-dependent protease/predicted transcriptional regulator